MGIFSKTGKSDTKNWEAILDIVKQEVAEFQTEVDNRFSYKKAKTAATSATSLGAHYDFKDDDCFLVKFNICFDRNRYYDKRHTVETSEYSFFINAIIQDLYLHPEDIHKSGNEKFNTVQLRPLGENRYREIACGSLKGCEAYEFIWENLPHVYDRINAIVKERFGTKAICVPKASEECRYHYSDGKPEQYREYFTNVAKAESRGNPNSHIFKYYKETAKSFGLELTDEDILNSKGIDYNQSIITEDDIKKYQDRIKKQDEDLEEEKRLLKEKRIAELAEKRRNRQNGAEVKQESQWNISPEFSKKIAKELSRKRLFKRKVSVDDDISIRSKKSYQRREKRREKKENKVYSEPSKISLVDILLGVGPLLILAFYIICVKTDLLMRIFTSTDFGGGISKMEPFFGYKFNLTNLVLEWMDETKYGVFSAITLGLLQLICLILSVIVDLIVYLLILILYIIMYAVLFVLSVLVVFVIPVAIPVWHIINIFRSRSQKIIFAGACALISVAGCIYYFIGLFQTGIF